MAKDPGAFKTIGELSAELGVAQHILRYWESKFPQLKPLQRAGNRRYYRPADAELAQRIHHLLVNQSYTIRGVQKLLGVKGGSPPDESAFSTISSVSQVPPAPPAPPAPVSTVDLDRLVLLRDRLVAALGE